MTTSFQYSTVAIAARAGVVAHRVAGVRTQVIRTIRMRFPSAGFDRPSAIDCARIFQESFDKRVELLELLFLVSTHRRSLFLIVASNRGQQMSSTTIRRDTGKKRYPDSVLNDIFDAVAGGKSIVDVCGENRDFPAAVTVYRWMNAEPELHARYQEAMRIAAAKKTA